MRKLLIVNLPLVLFRTAKICFMWMYKNACSLYKRAMVLRIFCSQPCNMAVGINIYPHQHMPVTTNWPLTPNHVDNNLTWRGHDNTGGDQRTSGTLDNFVIIEAICHYCPLYASCLNSDLYLHDILYLYILMSEEKKCFLTFKFLT